MNIVCSNCHTGRDMTNEEVKRLNQSTLHCKTCGKKMRIEFCPHCNAFYSITFSNIKEGQYRYKCRKCGEDFHITFKNENKLETSTKNITEQEKKTKTYREVKSNKGNLGKRKAPSNAGKKIAMESIEEFSLRELFKSLQQSFKMNKIVAASVGVVCLLIISQIFSSLENIILSEIPQSGPSFLSSFMNLFPLAIMFTFFILTASVIAKITLGEIFMQGEQKRSHIINFALTSAPSILLGNIVALLTINAIIILFGKIPLLGPLLFSLAFLPVYLSSVLIFIIVSIGVWFYPAIAAHRERGILKSLKNLLIFIKKHNYRLLMVLPVMTTLALIAFGVIFIIHSSAMALTISASRAILNGDSSVFFSAIPANFIKASEITLMGLNNSLFKGLYPNLSLMTEVGGVVLGVTTMAISILLWGVFISIMATISTHFYIMMERGLEIKDKKMLAVLSLLVLLLTAIIQLKKIFS